MADRLPARSGSGVRSRSSTVLVVVIGFDDKVGFVRVTVVFVRLASGPESDQLAASRAAADATFVGVIAAARISEIVVLPTEETATEGQQAGAVAAAVRIRVVRADVPLASAAKTRKRGESRSQVSASS